MFSLLCGYFTSGITWICASIISAFFSSVIIFGCFSFFGVTVKVLLLIGQKNDRFFSEFTGWSYSGYASTIGTITGSSLVNGFDWDALFILSLSWFTSFSFSWTTSLTGTLRGTAREVGFLNISARFISASLCPSPSFTSGISGAVFCGAQIKSCAA